MRHHRTRWMLALLFFATLPARGAVAGFPDVVDSSFTDANGDRTLQLSIVVSASASDAFAAFATADGWKTWAVPFAVGEPRVGAVMETAYWLDAKPGDRGNIRNQFIAWLPERLLPYVRAVAMFAPLALAVAAHAALPSPERVEFPSLAADATGTNVIVPALLFRPPRVATDGATALIVALHGCGGMFSARRGSEHALSDSFAQWTAQLLDDGYAVLWPDSFTPRGQREVCTIKTGERTINAATRRLDALGALRFATALSGIDAQRIAVVGWSHGGSTTLAAINGEDPRIAALLAGAGAPPFFRAAVAFYPGCASSLRAGAKWRPVTTTAIHIGGSDDWTPAAPCVELGEAMRAASQPLTVSVYPDAYHGFDAPSGRVTVRKDVPNGVNPGQGVTRGPNPPARALANDRVRAFLREQLAATATMLPPTPAPSAATSTQ